MTIAYLPSSLPRRHVANIHAALTSEHPEWHAAFERLRDSLKTGFILSMLGDRGTGKTQMAVCLARDAVRLGMTVEYVTAYKMFVRIRSAYKDDGPPEERMVSEFVIPRLLIVDEFHERRHSDFEEHLLTHIVDRRYADMKDTLLVSNYTKEGFQAAVGGSILSRMEECGGYIICKWASFRRSPAPGGTGKHKDEESE